MTLIVGPWKNSTPPPKRKRGVGGLFSVSIDDLSLSVRAYNCLRLNDVYTVGDLVEKKRSDLLKTRNFGRKSLHEVEKILDALGLALAKERWELLKEKEAEARGKEPS